MHEHVLLVDDEVALTDALRRALSREPYQIPFAKSGAEALEILAGVNIDVLVTDKQMPRMSGLELLHMAAERFPDTLRIMLTGKADLDTAVEAINSGQVYRFFTKPCNHVELAIAIRDALQQRRLLRHARDLLGLVEEQSEQMRRLEREMPGITRLTRSPAGVLLVDEPPQLEDVVSEINAGISAIEKSLGVFRRM